MDRNTGSECAGSADSWSARDGASQSERSRCKTAFRLTRGEALILVLLLSLGLWAAIWGVVALLAVGGL